MTFHRCLALVLFLAAPLARGEEVLDNDAVARLLRAGLSADVVVLKIERTAGRYDVTSEALIALKNAGAPDAVLKAMLLKDEPPHVAAPAPATPPRVATAPAAETCTALRYYTTGNNGWAWLPASVCVAADAIAVDEQRVPLARVTAQCRVKALALLGGSDDGEWWFSDGAETHKFRGTARELDAIEAAVTHAAPSVPRGSCSERDVRRLLATGRR